MKSPEKREFWIFQFKFGPDESISQNCVVSLDKGGSKWLDHVHVVSAEWAESEIQRLKEALKEAKSHLDHTERCHNDIRTKCICYYEKLKSEIDEVARNQHQIDLTMTNITIVLVLTLRQQINLI